MGEQVVAHHAVEATHAGGAYRHDVQGLRAIAVLAVILYHAAGLLPGGFVGVDVFFVISGFVITGSLVRESERNGRISLVSFYRRRVLRLTPALTVCLVIVIPLSVLFAPLAVVPTTIATGVAASLLSANIVMAEGPGYFDLGAESNALAHTWSLSLEEQFYLVFPAIIVVLTAVGARRVGLRRALTVGLAALAALSLVGCLLAAQADGTVFDIPWTRVAFFAMPLRAWQFIAGALVALAASRAASRQQSLLAIVGLFLVIASFVRLEELPYPTAWAIVPTVGTMLLLGTPSSVVARGLSWGPLVRAGDISYSWYLWHWPPMVFARVAGVESPVLLVAIGLATYPIAALSYRHVEQRVRHPKGARRRGWIRIFVASIVVTALVAGASLAAFDRAKERRAEAQAALAAGISGLTEPCRPVSVGGPVTGCVFGDGTRRVALVGDSNAAQFTSTVVAAARPLDASVTVVTENGCPAVDVAIVRYGEVDSACRDFATATLPWVVSQAFDVVVLANAFDMYLQRSVDHVESTQPGSDAEDTEAYVDALATLVAQLEGAGTQVVIVNPIPKPAVDKRGWENFRTGTGCSLVGVLAGDSDLPLGCRDGFDGAEARARQRVALEAERAAASGTSATLLDPFAAVCGGEQCQAHRDGEWVYLDYGHLAYAFSERVLTDPFGVALDRALGP